MKQCSKQDCELLSCTGNAAFGKCEKHGGREQVWRTLLSRCRACAKVRKHPGPTFGIEFFKEMCDTQNGKCFYCAIDMRLALGGRYLRQVSVERLDNDISYTEQNVRLTCFACNFGRNYSQLADFCDWVAVAYGGLSRTLCHPPCHRNNQWSSNCRRSPENWNTTMVTKMYERQNGKCALTGVDLCKCNVHHCPFAPSIDRIDNNKGHEETNCAMVCMAANLSRNNATLEDFKQTIIEKRACFDTEQRNGYICPPPLRVAFVKKYTDTSIVSRTCYKCKETKLLNQFHVHNNRLGDYHRECKDCKTLYNSQYKALHPRVIRQNRQLDEKVLRPNERVITCKYCGKNVPEHGMSRGARGGCKQCSRIYDAKMKQQKKSLPQGTQYCRACETSKSSDQFTGNRVDCRCNDCKQQSNRISKRDHMRRKAENKQTTVQKLDAERAILHVDQVMVTCSQCRGEKTSAEMSTRPGWCRLCTRKYDAERKANSSVIPEGHYICSKCEVVRPKEKPSRRKRFMCPECKKVQLRENTANHRAKKRKIIN